MKLKQIQKLAKLFNEKTKESTVIPEKDYQLYPDPTVVSGVIPKTTGFRDAFLSTFDVEPGTVPLDYSGQDYTGCSYPTEYLRIVLDFMKSFDDEKVLIKMKKDYPIWFEFKEFIIIIAPRSD